LPAELRLVVEEANLQPAYLPACHFVSCRILFRLSVITSFREVGVTVDEALSLSNILLKKANTSQVNQVRWNSR
jgi:hypothetical protein